MLQLPNGCRCSTPTVFPPNWKTAGASIKKDWRIQYYFYDPVHKPKGKLIIVKAGINKFHTVNERRDATRLLYDALLSTLKQDGYNPVTGGMFKIPNAVSEIMPGSGLVPALEYALEKIIVVKDTRSDIKSMMKYFAQAARETGIAGMPVAEVRRRHIKHIMEHCTVTRQLSAYRQNKYRTYLSMLFAELAEREIVESNFIHELKLQKTERKYRDTLTPEERMLVNDHLQKKHYSFWRFLLIYFDSTPRITELLAVKRSDVDLARQRFKVTVHKGKNAREIWKTIKDVAVEYWQEILEDASENDYLFSTDLRPGKNKILRGNITRRWREHVKHQLGIKADFTSLRNLSIDEAAEALDIMAAAKMAGHTTPVVTLNHYTKGEEERQHDRLKKINNTFVKQLNKAAND
ncbi:MAG: tyrosine-type recombinase/integrase [Ferruginibacter sp.]